MYSKIVCGLALAYGASAFPDGAHGGHHAAADPSGYNVPAAQPSSGYETPAAQPSYPASAYEEPASYDYGSSPGYGAEEAPFDISTLIIPLLIIAGLSLLFPTITTVSVRKKRDIAEDVNPMTDVVERVNDIYSAVVQSEECMERIACEIGGLAADVGLKQSPAVQLAAGFVPSKYKSYYKQFASGKDCQKIKCGTFA